MRAGTDLRGMARRNVIIGLVIAGFLFVLLAIGAVRARELSRRTVCTANLYGSIGIQFYGYASNNRDMFPIPPHLAAEADGVGRVRYAPGKIGTHRNDPKPPASQPTTNQDTEMSSTRCFWLLIRTSSASPQSFVCPSNPEDKANNEPDPQQYWDFRNFREISYGYQVPFGKHGQAGAMRDNDMVLAADKGSYGQAIEAGGRNPGVPQLSSGNAPKEWRAYNSSNHWGEGQIVLYTDGRTEFATTPLAGWKKDNIYTRWSRADADKDGNELARVQGTPPTGIETPFGDTDSLIYP